MNTTDYKNFLADCKQELSEGKTFDFHNNNEDLMLSDVFRRKEYIKQVAANIRNKFINNIADNLVVFDKNFSANGGIINWCIDYNDFLSKLDKILLKNKIKNVNLFSSYFSEELGIDRFLKNKDYNCDVETKECIIFTPKYGIINTGSLFLNFDSAYDMEIVLNGKTKIFIISICDFIFKAEDVEIFSFLYSIYKSGINFPYLTSIYTPNPSRNSDNVYLFLVDNGRSNVLENKDIRSALTCIDCDACKKVCPVYNLIGDKPYKNVFSGPLANVILPFIENFESYKHLCFSCTSCGNCSSVCPIKIPVSEMITSNKKYFFDNNLMEIKDERLAKTIYKFAISRKQMNLKRWRKNLKLNKLINSKILSEYPFEKSTFNKQFNELKNGK